MPRIPEDMKHLWDLDTPGTRLVERPALAIPIPEEEWATYKSGPEAALRRNVGDWIFEEQAGLGRGEAVDGAAGSGAEAWIPVVEFVAIHAAGGVIATAAGMTFRRVWKRATEALRGRKPLVSRGGAAALAVAEVAERFGGADRLEVEAVEEPSSIRGNDVATMSYLGEEPWIVLLRDRERKTRYVVVVAPEGEILGSIEAPMTEAETMFLPPAESE